MESVLCLFVLFLFFFFSLRWFVVTGMLNGGFYVYVVLLCYSRFEARVEKGFIDHACHNPCDIILIFVGGRIEG